MKYINLSFQHDIEKIIADHPSFKIVEKPDESIAHEILESQGMQLLENLRLSYSRRPNLWKSFDDSNQKALVFFEQEFHTTIGALSESECYYKNKKIISYYTSDLRVSPKAPMRIRKEFREVYQKFIAALPAESICTTAILKENIKAMNTFTRGSNNLFYNEMFEYLIRTIVILPTIFFNLRPKLQGYKIKQLSEVADREAELNHFIAQYEQTAEFSNNILKSRIKKLCKKDEFIITKDEKIVGYFSLLRPLSRSIYVQTTSIWVKILLKTLSILSPTDLSIKLPWVYLTSLVLSPDLKSEDALLSRIVFELKRFKRLKIGELLLLVHPMNGQFTKEKRESSFILKCPQIINTGVLFSVEKERIDRKIFGNIHIDPSEL